MLEGANVDDRRESFMCNDYADNFIQNVKLTVTAYLDRVLRRYQARFMDIPFS